MWQRLIHARFIGVLSFCVVAPTLLYAQTARSAVICNPRFAQTASHNRALWSGYQISLGPTREDVKPGEEDGCTAAIRNRAGEIVFQTTGYSVDLDESLTGTDFDGDGQPDVVFATDTGGGTHCCYQINVISLSPQPHKLFDVEADGDIRFDKDARGNIIIWQQVTNLSSRFLPNADRPSAEKVLRVVKGEVVDATPEFCTAILNGATKGYPGVPDRDKELTSANLRKLQSSPTVDVGGREVAGALLSRAYQRVFCRRFDEALNDLDLWPEPSRGAMKAEFADAIKAQYAEFAARLADKNKK